ncbi:Crp/Fnr family transcriptional regulator [Lentzea flaviverrucosa]|uniref:cAMP-binding domain of CRP or a regulatory subunit of cAMP-dependent protein kinases n=1 Tax=Lentzea flaviverrucosa TaxID=200379 RepID=A0A1H9XYC9_9PSEU|nr:Crp/Fnr family transcriptional regulator [Lentzea flaviverrucosa]RDI16385.1 Crp/Fnr family transcriptional regulator [Lentzea flaviverrucosa]SES51208.1 cAMP-binding domain of CRP or a regulatory subunit of cAMP-dependent protein kinases [Lentzea flaviverrucosa]
MSIVPTTDPVLAKLAASAGEQVRFSRGQKIFTQGDSGQQLYIVHSGKVKIGRCTAEGREHLLSICGPADMFGELSVLDPGPRAATATAVTDVSLLSVDGAALREQIKAHPELAVHMLRVLARRVRRSNTKVGDVIFADVPGRVAKTLLELAMRFGEPDKSGTKLDHELSQQEIAQYIGASRETVNKVLSHFAHRGWLQVNYKSALILDPARLARIAR